MISVSQNVTINYCSSLITNVATIVPYLTRFLQHGHVELLKTSL